MFLFVEILLKNLFSVISYLQDQVKGMISKSSSKEGEENNNEDDMDKDCAERVKQVKYDPCNVDETDFQSYWFSRTKSLLS